MQVPCAHSHCPNFAVLSVKQKTGWANLCRNHYELLISAEAREFCQTRGLTTRQKQLEFIRERLTSIRNRGLKVKLPALESKP